jgi:hypothetical protein
MNKKDSSPQNQQKTPKDQGNSASGIGSMGGPSTRVAPTPYLTRLEQHTSNTLDAVEQRLSKSGELSRSGGSRIAAFFQGPKDKLMGLFRKDDRQDGGRRGGIRR